MDKSTKALSDIAAAMGIYAKDLVEKGDIDKLKIKILEGIDSLENHAECVEKQKKEARHKVSYWRGIARSCLRSEI